MLQERIINLINEELDGELSAADRAELEAVLQDSEEARAMREELQRLGTWIGSMPEVEPPANLREQILAGVPLPRSQFRPSISFGSLFASFQPAQAGLAFAAGLLLAVGYYELSPAHRESADPSQMVGTLIAGKQPAAVARVETLAIRESGVKGTISLRKSGSFQILDFDLDSQHTSEVEISFAGAGLSFGGIAHTTDGPDTAAQSYEVSGGTLRVANQGRQAFSVFLKQAAAGDSGSQGINIGISSGGERRYDGVFRG